MIGLIWIILDIVLLVLSVVVWISIEGENPLKYATLSSFLFLTLILLLWGRKKIIPIIKTQTFKNYSRELTTLVLVIFIFAIINFLGVKNNYQKDLTMIKIHSLSQQTKNILKLYDKPLKIRYLAQKQNWGRYDELLSKYQYENNNFSYEFIDPNTHPALVSQYDLKQEGSAIISYEGSENYGPANSELKLTNLLIKLSRKEEFRLCYSDTHKELDLKSKENDGLSYLADSFRNSLYHLQKVDLLAEKSIASHCDLFMILGARSGFMQSEITKIQEYLERGGNLLVSLAPVFGENKLKNIFDFLEQNGIKAINSIVIDRLASVQGSQATIPLINDYNEHHPITRGFKERTIFPLSLALKASHQNNFRYTSLASTSSFPASWAEMDINEMSKGSAKYDLEKDLSGPVDVLSVSENLKSFSRMAVFGSSSVFLNAYQGNSANFNLVLNTVAWLIDDTGLVSLNRPSLTQKRVFVSSGQMNLILFVSLGLIPLILFAISFYMFKRRNSH